MNSVYSKDPQVSNIFLFTIGILLITSLNLLYLQLCLSNAFQQRDLGDFIFANEFLNADLNQNQNDLSGLTFFQHVLRTPGSADYIRNCVANGADCYGVKPFQEI